MPALPRAIDEDITWTVVQHIYNMLTRYSLAVHPAKSKRYSQHNYFYYIYVG